MELIMVEVHTSSIIISFCPALFFPEVVLNRSLLLRLTNVLKSQIFV